MNNFLMKKILLLLITVTAFSCSSDDNAALTSNTLDGTWVQVTYKMSNESSEMDMSNCDAPIPAMKYVFNPNGSFTSQSACDENSEVNTFSYSLNGSEVTLISPLSSKTYSMTDIGNEKVKLTLLNTTTNGETEDNSSSGNYSVFLKQ